MIEPGGGPKDRDVGQQPPPYRGIVTVLPLDQGADARPVALGPVGTTTNFYGSYGWDQQVVVLNR